MVAIEDKLSRVRFNVDSEPHIRIDAQICENCAEKPCLYVCPVQNYSLEDGGVVFSWQGCVECGACRVVCDRGAISWAYPRGGYGVYLRYG
jgi:ferredoxin like protein